VSSESSVSSRACSIMADDEEAVVLACTSLVVCALCVHVKKTRKRQHAVRVKDYMRQRESFNAKILTFKIVEIMHDIIY